MRIPPSPDTKPASEIDPKEAATPADSDGGRGTESERDDGAKDLGGALDRDHDGTIILDPLDTSNLTDTLTPVVPAGTPPKSPWIPWS